MGECLLPLGTFAIHSSRGDYISGWSCDEPNKGGFFLLIELEEEEEELKGGVEVTEGGNSL